MAALLPLGCIPDLGVIVSDGGPIDVGAGTGDALEQDDGGASDAGDAQEPRDASVADAGGKSALAAEGDTVFHTLKVPPYGNVGCAYCHCSDAAGGCRFSAPRVVGKSRSSVANALQTVEEMQVLSVSEHQIDALAAFLGYLAGR